MNIITKVRRTLLAGCSCICSLGLMASSTGVFSKSTGEVQSSQSNFELKGAGGDGNYTAGVIIDPSVQRFIGGVSNLDRSKFFTYHGNGGSPDADVAKFMKDYGVTPGRSFWGPFSYAKSKTGSVGKYPTMRNNSSGSTQKVRRYIATEHPHSAFKWKMDRTKAANWVVDYYKNWVDANDRPEYFEPINEPFVHASDDTFKKDQSDDQKVREQMAELFAEIGKKVHQAPELKNMKIIGYADAWPSMELWNFKHWNTRMKMFMDKAGEHMDGFSTHLYDGINVTGQDNYRSGSNSEAILDLIEAYSYLKWGKVKEHAISEYGGIEKGYGDNYNDIANVQSIKAINRIIFNLLERENNLAISIPFITEKAKWHITKANNYQPYGAVLFKPTNIGEPNPKGWTYTPRINFYKIWKGVKGKRIRISSTNPDVQVQSFIDGKNMYVCLNNLSFSKQKVQLQANLKYNDIKSVRKRSLKIYDKSNPVFKEEALPSSPSSVELIDGETVVLVYELKNNVSFTNSLRGNKYYANKYMQAISANKTLSFGFSNVKTGTGNATLRMSIGRKHNVSKKPIIKVNGTKVNVPSNWKGYDQSTRSDFFGTIEIPVPMSILKSTNNVTVTFTDNGGYLSSLVLYVERYDNAEESEPSVPTEESLLVTPNEDLTIVKGSDFTGKVTFTAAEDREVAVEFWNQTEWLAASSNTVESGEGSYNFSIDLPTDLPVGDQYFAKVYMFPVGKTWREKTAEYVINTISLVNAGSETIAFTEQPAGVIASKTVSATVSYVANQTRDLVLELWNENSYLTEERVTVNSGSGNKKITFTFDEALAIGDGYRFKASIRPVGTKWTENIKGKDSPTFMVYSAKEAISFNYYPETLISSKTVSVKINYQTNQQRDIMVELWHADGFVVNQRTTINAGTGIKEVTLTADKSLEVRDDYYFKTSIRPVGGTWKETIVGENTSKIKVTAYKGNDSYFSTIPTLPGTLECEYYDKGGKGKAYIDNEEANYGKVIRLSEGVDVEVAQTGGYNIGYIKDGEWVTYTVKVEKSGTYLVKLNYASKFDTGKMTVYSSAGNASSKISMGVTGDWQVYKNKSFSMDLKAGIQTIKLYFDKGRINANKISFELTAIKNLEVSNSLQEVLTSPNYSVYPNPTSQFFRIKGLDKEQLTTIEIYSMQGVKQGVYKVQDEASIDVSGLPSGQYVVRILLSNGTESTKLLKL